MLGKPRHDTTRHGDTEERPESPTHQVMMSGRKQGLREVATRHYNEISNLRGKFLEETLPKRDQSLEQFNPQDWTHYFLTSQEQESYKALIESLKDSSEDEEQPSNKFRKVLQSNSKIDDLINNPTKDSIHLTNEKQHIKQFSESLDDLNQTLGQIEHLQDIIQSSINKMNKSSDPIKESYNRFKESINSVKKLGEYPNIDTKRYYQIVDTFSRFIRNKNDINPNNLVGHLERLEKNMIYRTNDPWHDKVETFHQRINKTIDTQIQNSSPEKQEQFKNLKSEINRNIMNVYRLNENASLDQLAGNYNNKIEEINRI
jgi:hypothetical protein